MGRFGDGTSNDLTKGNKITATVVVPRGIIQL